MAIKNYLCKNCGTLVQKDSSPSSSGCPSATFHDWKDLGEVGNTTYLCKNCGKSVNSKSNPSSSGCPSATFHDWRKL